MLDIKSNEDYIAIFDSGLGGISVLNTIREVLPNENLLYFGDSAHNPYGIKSPAEVKSRVFELVEILLKKRIKALVIACNTATSAAADDLRNSYDFPIIGMEPALKPAIEAGCENIVVLATEITLKEKKFNNLMTTLKTDGSVYKAPASCLVDLVENDNISKSTVELCLDSLCENFKLDINKLDGIVLGCTHFIFAEKEIKNYFSSKTSNKIRIFNGNMGTALYLKSVLEAKNLTIDYGEARGEFKVVNEGRGETLILDSDFSALERLKKYVR